MIVRELDGKAEMLNYLSVMQELYPSLTLEDYDTDLTAMIPNNKYGQVALNGESIKFESFSTCGDFRITKHNADFFA